LEDPGKGKNKRNVAKKIAKKKSGLETRKEVLGEENQGESGKEKSSGWRKKG